MMLAQYLQSFFLKNIYFKSDYNFTDNLSCPWTFQSDLVTLN